MSQFNLSPLGLSRYYCNIDPLNSSTLEWLVGILGHTVKPVLLRAKSHIKNILTFHCCKIGQADRKVRQGQSVSKLSAPRVQSTCHSPLSVTFRSSLFNILHLRYLWWSHSFSKEYKECLEKQKKLLVLVMSWSCYNKIPEYGCVKQQKVIFS